MQTIIAQDLRKGQKFRYPKTEEICHVLNLTLLDNPSFPEEDFGKLLVNFEKGGRCRQMKVDTQCRFDIINTRFVLLKSRKPWNQLAGWLLLQIMFLIEEADNLSINTMEQFIERLERDFNIHCEKEKKNPNQVSLISWKGMDRIYLGINRPNSADACPIVVTTTEKTH